MKRKKTILVITLMVMAFIIVPAVQAEFWSCFGRGEVIDFCDSRVQDRTCGATSCQYCMDEYDAVNNCFIQGNFNVCNAVGGSCSEIGTGTLDVEAPEFTLNGPIENSLHTERRVLIDIDLNEEGDIYYTDLNDGRGRWTRICTNCDSSSKERSFDEGENNLRFRVRDNAGNEDFFDLTFFIDSKDPSISKTLPTRGFANGFFYADFKEDNPESLTLKYGTFDDMRSKSVNIDTECYIEKKKHKCETFVPLEDFDGMEIEYWFEMTDIVGNFDDSRIRSLDVDTTDPFINSVGFEVDGKKATIIMDITEPNLDEIEYYDNDTSRPKWRRLCSRLKEGICEKRITLSGDDGDHHIDIQAIDEAGNMVSTSLIIPKT